VTVRKASDPVENARHRIHFARRSLRLYSITASTKASATCTTAENLPKAGLEVYARLNQVRPYRRLVGIDKEASKVGGRGVDTFDELRSAWRLF
jgi:hypothetical protein